LQGLSVTLVNLNGQAGYTLWGTPVGMDQRVKSLAVTVDAQGVIHMLRVEETDGAITTFSFSEMHENVPVNDADFRFIPPAGVVIIDGANPV
jgi:outer membrane lipoprotein carrier protein